MFYIIQYLLFLRCTISTQSKSLKSHMLMCFEGCFVDPKLNSEQLHEADLDTFSVTVKMVYSCHVVSEEEYRGFYWVLKAQIRYPVSYCSLFACLIC